VGHWPAVGQTIGRSRQYGTIHNLGVLLGAISMPRFDTTVKAEPEQISERRRHEVLFGFTGTLILIVFIIVATVWGMIPCSGKQAGRDPLKQGNWVRR
jgi:hypothetical protein